MDRNAQMTKPEALSFIEEKILPVVRTYWETGNVQHVTPTDQDNLKTIWNKAIQPGHPLDTGCASCVKFGLDIVGSWWQRESRKNTHPFSNPPGTVGHYLEQKALVEGEPGFIGSLMEPTTLAEAVAEVLAKDPITGKQEETEQDPGPGYQESTKDAEGNPLEPIQGNIPEDTTAPEDTNKVNPLD